MFDLFLAYSDFGRHAFADLEGEVLMTRGPVDTEYYAPSFSTNRRGNDIVALGRCLPHKGFDRIIRSLPCGPRLKIIGSRTDQDYFRYLNELASGKSVVFVEGLEDTAVRDVLRSAGLFVHASCHFDY
jgi:glycosyltransferase involved in cell wall biosynthesis